MNFDGDAITFTDVSQKDSEGKDIIVKYYTTLRNPSGKYPKTVTYALSENKTLIANEAGLSGNYQPVDKGGISIVGGNTFQVDVDSTTIDIANGQIANHAQFNFNHPDTKGFTLNS